MTEKAPPPLPTPPPTPELERRLGLWVWVAVLLAFCAGIAFYFRFQGMLAPMFGRGGK
jgi:hypothetical protein